MARETIERNISEQSAPAVGRLVARVAQFFAAGYEIESIEVTEDEDGDPVLRVVLEL